MITFIHLKTGKDNDFKLTNIMQYLSISSLVRISYLKNYINLIENNIGLLRNISKNMEVRKWK